MTQRGAAATKRSRLNHCAGCGNTAVSRRAEKGDFVAQRWELRVGSADEQFEGKSLEPHADLRFQRRLSNITLQRSHCLWPHCPLPKKQILKYWANSHP